MKITTSISSLSILCVTAVVAIADDGVELSKKLANPVSDLISFPIQANFDYNFGSDDNGEVWVTNVQPVIPISLNEDWRILSRTVIPIIDQSGFQDESLNTTGLGDTVQSLFLAPQKSPKGIWGVGPAFLLPTSTDDVLGGDKWGIGPTGVVAKQAGPWTYGLLANHLWDFAGPSNSAGVSLTSVQPFVKYVTQTKTTLSLTTESLYNWRDEQWSIPLNAVVAQMVKINEQPMQVFAGVRYWADAPDNGAEGFGFRVGCTFIFPK